MKKIDTTNIAGLAKAPFIKATHDHIKESIMENDSDIIKGLLSDYTTNDLILLYGCVVSATIPGTSSITAGAIYYNGEIYRVDADAALVTTGSDTLVWGVVTTYIASDATLQWSDGGTRNLHQINKLALSAGASGSGLANYNGSTVKYYDTGWQTLTAENNWVNTSAKYRRIGNTVYMKGKFTANADETSATMATLPTGCRPALTLTIPCYYSTGSNFGAVIIPSTGTIGASSFGSGFTLGVTSCDVQLENVVFTVG